MLPVESITPWLERALDLSSRRASLLQSNVANADTPGFIPTDLEFDQTLEAELNHRAHFGPLPGEPMAHEVYDVEPGLDGNRVDLDREITAMASNKIKYDTTLELLNRHFALNRYAIDEGGR